MADATTMVRKVTETAEATNIYLTEIVAVTLARRILAQVGKNTGIRLVILNKREKPDIAVYPYDVINLK